MTTTFYIFGIQRSGTNFLERLLVSNFKNMNRGNRQSKVWKHALDVPKAYDKNSPTLIIYKNPYTWTESLLFRKHVDWLKSQKKFSVLDLHDDPDYNFDVTGKQWNMINLVESWRYFHNTWLYSNNTNPANTVVIQYEDLLQKPSRNAILEHIQTKLKLTQIVDTWNIPGKGSVSQSKDYSDDREKYYLDMKPTKFTPKQIQAITDTIGEEMIRNMGYDIL